MKFINILFFIILITSNLFASTNKKLKIAVINDMVPYSFLNDENKSDGIFVDYWKLWSKKTGIEIEFVSYDWKQSLEAVANNEVDIHSGLFKSPASEKFVNYVKPIYPSISLFYANKSNKLNINDYKGNQDKTVGVIKGSYFETYLRKKFPALKIQQFSNFNERLEDIKNSDIDLFIDDSLIAWYKMINTLSFNNIKTVEGFELKKWFYAGVRKNDDELVSLVNNGINLIKEEDLVEIEKKWIFKDDLRFYERKRKVDILNYEERIWLLKNSPKLAVIKDWEKYSVVDDFGNIKGFHIDLIKLINKTIKTNIKYKIFDNWTSAYNSAKDSKVDGILGLSWSKQRQRFFDYSPSYHYNPYYILVRKNDDSIKSIEDFDTKRAATFDGSITNKVIQTKAPNTKITHINSIEGILKAISTNEVDTAIIASAKDIDLDVYGLKIADAVFTKYGELHIGTSKDNKIFTSIINKALSMIDSNELEKLKEKWLYKKIIFSKEEQKYISESPVLKVGIEDWTAIMGTRDGKTIEGVGAEIVQKAFNISGLTFEFVKDDWDVLLKAFKEGKIDILPTTLYTKQRATYGEYSQKYLSVQNYLYVRNDNNGIKSFEDLRGKKLAIQKDFGTISLVKSKYPSIDIVETKNLEDSIQRVLNKEVDALFELQLSVESKMREFLITNLKSIAQNSIKPMGLHIFSKKNDVLLQSILNKSLDAIPLKEKNKIITKWLTTFDLKKDIKVAFGSGREPYVLDKDFIKGIEYDLLTKVLNLSSLRIENSKNIPISELKNILKLDSSFDIAVNTDYENDGEFYYSNEFFAFENVVVSKSDKKDINSIKDLKGEKVMAFFNAHKYLGDEYSSILNPSNKNYKETQIQEEQVKALVSGEVDYIILDKNIFKWHFLKQSNETLNKYKMNKVFPRKNPRYIAFRDKALRDLFNRNLELIKQSGSYDEVFDDYTKGYIEPKVKINSLIAAIVANNIFTEQITELNKIVEIFTVLPYIEKIEVFNIENELLVSSSNKDLKDYTIQDSYHFIVNVPTKVGFIKVYFDNSLLKVYQGSNGFIPRVQEFEELKSYAFIKNVYKKFGYFTNTIDFSREEKEFLKTKKVITFSEINWEPLIMIENDKFSGLFSDYLKLIEKDTGLKFKFEKSENWQDVLDKFDKGEIDMIPALGDIAFSLKKAFVTNSMTDFKFAIVSNKDASYLDGLKSLKDKTVALPKDYSSYNLIKNRFPDIKIKETATIKEALNLVVKNEVDAFVGHSAISVYEIQNEYPDLKIVGLSEERFNHYILIQDKYPELLSILNKAIFNITPKQKFDIKNKWIKTEVSTEIDYELLYKIVAIFTFILVVVLIFTRKLSKAKKEAEFANKKLKETVDALEEQKSAFQTLFYDTYDGLSLIKNGEFIECNDAVVKMLKYKNKEEFLNLKPHQLSPEFQPCGKRSVDKAKEILDDCMQSGSARFEWVHVKSTGEEFWVEIVLTKIVLNHEDVIHVVWRDIADKKTLEVQNLKRTEELEKTNEELEVSIKNLKDTQDQLIESEKMASLGGLVAGVAHEINTPIGIGLTGASHFKEISKTIKTSYEKELMTQEDFEEYLKTSNELSILIDSNLKRAANLVKSFKQVAVDQTSEETRRFNLYNYIHEILASIHSVTKKTNLDIFVSCHKDITINSYPGAFSQIITNLIMNSIIHAYEPKQKGKLSIEIIKKENKITINYKDDGKGIPEENIHKIFDPFFTTNRENGGSGLGLNIIYNIVTTKLNGKIICKNNDKGVEFIITFKV